MRWSTDGPPGPATIVVSDGVATLRAENLEKRTDAAEFSRDGFLELACAHFRIGECVEVLACLRHGPLPTCEPPEGRPSVGRTLGFGGRGSRDPGAWILGRTVRLSAHRGPDLALEDVLEAGLPEGVPETLAAQLRAAAEALAPLPCMCGTGTETPEQHGAIELLAGPVQHPRAPIEHTASVGRCRVCQRCWVFERSGDSHYDFRCWMRPLLGRASSP